MAAHNLVRPETTRARFWVSKEPAELRGGPSCLRKFKDVRYLVGAVVVVGVVVVPPVPGNWPIAYRMPSRTTTASTTAITMFRVLSGPSNIAMGPILFVGSGELKGD